MKARVLVLGCGPSGLIAAHAASWHLNAEVKIVSVKRPSQLFGCQYLHEDIPGIPTRGPESVSYELRGTIEGYRKKVYGSLTPPVSPQQLAGEHLAWDLRRAYTRLWDMYEESVVIDAKLAPTDIVPLLNDFMPDACISSLPAPVLCQRGSGEHTFTSVPCWAIGDAPELGQMVPIAPVEDFTVVCNGESEISWYRVCKVFGYSTVEWPGHKRKPPLSGVMPFNKPLSTDCDCMPSILRVGRYGRWSKGVLSHEAYKATLRKVKEFV